MMTAQVDRRRQNITMAPRHLCAGLLHMLLAGVVSVSCKWCNRTVAETHVYPITQYSMCQQSYQAKCGWLTSRMCTFYEMVDCAIEHNHTQVVYRLMAECCSGYYLDPETNSSCLKQPEEDVTFVNQYVPLTKLSLHDNNSLVNTIVNKFKGISTNYTLYFIGATHEYLFGLSHGALAGITCAFIFICCVVILIIIHILKKRRRHKNNKNEEVTEQEMNEKMITPTDVVQT